ncbi:hypothetical protein HAP94_11055 [Acidithiobacillus ferrivorans]|nr:hypothetical protein [Acidithiobacillus ferrivorans]
MTFLFDAAGIFLVFWLAWIMLGHTQLIGIFHPWWLVAAFISCSSSVVEHWLTMPEAQSTFILAVIADGAWGYHLNTKLGVMDFVLSFLPSDRSPPTDADALRVLQSARSFYMATVGGECLPRWLRLLRFGLLIVFLGSFFWLLPLVSLKAMYVPMATHTPLQPLPTTVWVGFTCYLLAMTIFSWQWFLMRKFSKASTNKEIRRFWLQKTAASWGGVQKLKISIAQHFPDIPEYKSWMAPFWRGDGVGITITVTLFILFWWVAHTLAPHSIVPATPFAGFLRVILVVGGVYLALLGVASVPEWRNFGQKERYFPLAILVRTLDEFS